MFIVLFSNYHARFIFRESSIRCLFFNFIETIVSFSNYFKTKTIVNVFKEEDDKNVIFSMMQTYREKYTNYETSFDRHHVSILNDQS